MEKIRYVLLIVVDPTASFVVGITKKKGPAFLLNRITFPGGKIETGESVVAAASREMREETGLDVAEEDWRVFEEFVGEDYELAKLVAVSDKVMHARQMEEEPVWHLDVQHHSVYALRQPKQYAPDFLKTLSDGVSAAFSAELNHFKFA